MGKHIAEHVRQSKSAIDTSSISFILGFVKGDSVVAWETGEFWNRLIWIQILGQLLTY